MTRPSDAALWKSVAATLRDTVLPTVDDGFARAALIQLVGLATYAAERGADPAAARSVELNAVLAGVELAGAGDGSPAERAGRLLASCAGSDSTRAERIRGALRPVLIAHLDADRAVTSGLGEAFRGRIPQ